MSVLRIVKTRKIDKRRMGKELNVYKPLHNLPRPREITVKKGALNRGIFFIV